jgi:hypothetical protein
LPFLAFMAVLYGGRWLLGLRIPAHLTAGTVVGFAVLLVAAFAVGTVVHELGHAVAVRLVGERVRSIELGGKLARVTFSLGAVPISIGLGLGGSITYASHGVSPARRAVVLAAGPVASILVAPCCLALPLPHWEASYLALCVLATAVQDLAPSHSAAGSSTDGYKLSRIPAELRAAAQVRELLADPCWRDRSDAAEILIDGFRLDVPEAEDCLRELCRQPSELRRVFTKPWTPPDRPEADVTHIVHILSWKVLLAGDLPAEAVDLAASRLEWVIDHLDREHADQRTPLHAVRGGLALARLRQQRPREVQRLCADALAADLDADDRATALALVAMARHALLLSGREQLDEALALDPNADLVAEAVRFLDGGWDTALAAHDQALRRSAAVDH